MNCPKLTHWQTTLMTTLIQHHVNVVCPEEREVKVILLLPRRATTSRNQLNKNSSIAYKKVLLSKFGEAGEAEELYMQSST